MEPLYAKVSRKQRFDSRENNLSSAIDVVEYKEEYRIFVDLPSVLPDSIRILVQKGGIRIEGVRCVQYDGCTKILLRRRPSGKFFVLLPCDHSLIEVSNAKATYGNGELSISLKKKPAALKRSFQEDHSKQECNIPRVDTVCTIQNCSVSEKKTA
ncbi:heat shock protein HSP20 [Blastocystis sp. subtype 4]|uniref:heat shock protein HSP20 n=1 Tax=Blastocystis sp. subtype 4 TaxID=944170 RepID=UPI00071166E2|nr:heat shock protein HSP20 [Blastocystis sp. subtype 4]KNB45105.1 heat shock protein HSP20 [Blastocystis sp. subtype 4]|eukprot:XP_014528548.1 heat shock protein HSP20 [Blastocystis sp. subtype 4]